MARLVTKFKYLKPTGSKKIGGYAKYIATREGVEKIDDTHKFAPSTVAQKNLINKIIKDFPDTKEMIEYADYLKTQNFGYASDFISRAIEDNAFEMMSRKTYADYIATRPRAEKFGTHGLFTDDGVEVKLGQVSNEMNLHNGNVWTIIISLRREDAERLGFDTGSRWRNMLRTQTQALSENLKIPMEHLKWFAAFHNESTHRMYISSPIRLLQMKAISQSAELKICVRLLQTIYSSRIYFVFTKNRQNTATRFVCKAVR